MRGGRFLEKSDDVLAAGKFSIEIDSVTGRRDMLGEFGSSEEVFESARRELEERNLRRAETVE